MSFGSGLTLLSVLGKMLRLVEEEADFSRFPLFHNFISTWLSVWDYQSEQNHSFIFQIWWALLASSQNPPVPSGECSRNVWGAFCHGPDEEEKCYFQSWPKTPRAVNDCYDSMHDNIHILNVFMKSYIGSEEEKYETKEELIKSRDTVELALPTW